MDPSLAYTRTNLIYNSEGDIIGFVRGNEKQQTLSKQKPPCGVTPVELSSMWNERIKHRKGVWKHPHLGGEFKPERIENVNKSPTVNWMKMMMYFLCFAEGSFYVYNLSNAISELRAGATTTLSATATTTTTASMTTTSDSTCALSAPVCCSFCDLNAANITNECAGCVAASFSGGGCCPLYGVDAGDIMKPYRTVALALIILTIITWCVQTYYLVWQKYPLTWSKYNFGCCAEFSRLIESVLSFIPRFIKSKIGFPGYYPPMSVEKLSQSYRRPWTLHVHVCQDNSRRS